MEIDKTKPVIWLRWVIANAIGEMVGLGAVFITGVSVFQIYGEPQSEVMMIGLFVLVILLAIFEGAVVGFAQWLILYKSLQNISAKEWILATIAGAVIAWILGMVPSTLSSMGDSGAAPTDEPPFALVMLFAAGLGAVAGIILSTAQWWVLRRHVSRSLLWLLANAIAWSVAMPIIFWLVGITIAESQAMGSIISLLLGIGVVGAIVGAIHGLFLIRLLSRYRVI